MSGDDYRNYIRDKQLESANDPKFTEDDYRDSIRAKRLESANDPKFTEDDYGFFCDLETAKTMEYEKVEYYVVKVSTKYEVRKKSVNEIIVPDPFPFIEKIPCCLQPESDVENVPENPKDDYAKSQKEQRRVSSREYFRNVFAYLSRLPREIYYSFVVCTVTSTCVYMVMTFSENSI
jgi:hypothetical protein